MQALEMLISTLTVLEFSQMTGKSISEIVECVNSEPVERPNGKPAMASSPLDVRTKAGRVDYQQRVLQEISDHGKTIGAEELRPLVGGTAPQLRNALKQLVKEGSLATQGKARGTTYRATGKKALPKKAASKTTKAAKTPAKKPKTKTDAELDTLSITILKRLRKKNATATAAWVSEALQEPRPTVEAKLTTLLDAGLVGEGPRGEGFRITTKGKNAY